MNNTEQSQQRRNQKAASEVLYLDCDDSNSDSKNSSKQLSERNMPGNLEPTKKYDQAMQSQKATATSSAPSIMNITNNSSFNDLRPRKNRNRLVAPTNNHHVTDSRSHKIAQHKVGENSAQMVLDDNCNGQMHHVIQQNDGGNGQTQVAIQIQQNSSCIYRGVRRGVDVP